MLSAKNSNSERMRHTEKKKRREEECHEKTIRKVNSGPGCYGTGDRRMPEKGEHGGDGCIHGSNSNGERHGKGTGLGGDVELACADL